MIFYLTLVIIAKYLGVAQFGSALEWGSRGRKFKSCHPDQVHADVVEWQTRRTQNPLPLKVCRFESDHRHHLNISCFTQVAVGDVVIVEGYLESFHTAFGTSSGYNYTQKSIRLNPCDIRKK